MSQETGKAFAYDHLKNYNSLPPWKKNVKKWVMAQIMFYLFNFFNIIYAHLEFEASNVFQKGQARQQKY